MTKSLKVNTNASGRGTSLLPGVGVTLRQVVTSACLPAERNVPFTSTALPFKSIPPTNSTSTFPASKDKSLIGIYAKNAPSSSFGSFSIVICSFGITMLVSPPPKV